MRQAGIGVERTVPLVPVRLPPGGSKETAVKPKPPELPQAKTMPSRPESPVRKPVTGEQRRMLGQLAIHVAGSLASDAFRREEPPEEAAAGHAGRHERA